MTKEKVKMIYVGMAESIEEVKEIQDIIKIVNTGIRFRELI